MPRQQPDPFRPPAREERSIDLAALPPRPKTPAVGGAPTPLPEARRPLKYRTPRTSWVTVLVLSFACIGVAAITTAVMKRMQGGTVVPEPEAAPQPVVYRPLAQDDAVLVTIQVTPPGAQLLLDGEPLRSNPARVPRGSKPHKLAATAAGFVPLVEEFTPDGPKTIKLKLARARRR